jgi:aryl-alcohol dehydrogenase-like predicted oxidoreductase
VRHRRVGTTDLEPSEVGFPVWDLVAGSRARSDEQAAGLLGAALDLGITWFSATDHDDGGRAEELLGAAVRGHRDEVTVATTFGYDTAPRLFEPAPPGGAGTSLRHDWSPGFAGRALDASLSRLRLEPIDLWQLEHPGMDAIESDELFSFLADQVRKGKVRYVGVVLGPGLGWSDEGIAALRERGVAAVETVYNVAEQDPGRELAAVAGEVGAGLVVRDPLAPRLPAAGRARLDFLARDRDQTIDQALLRFALADPAAATVLPPVTDAGRLAEHAAAADLPPPTGEDLDRIAELHEARFGLPPEERRPDAAEPEAPRREAAR